MPKFNERLKQLRKEKGLTQEELAKRLKITRSRLAMYEQGQRDPDTEMLGNMADFFNVDLDYITGRTFIKHQANMEYVIENNMDLESLVYLNKLSYQQLKKLIEVSKLMFPEV